MSAQALLSFFQPKVVATPLQECNMMEYYVIMTYYPRKHDYGKPYLRVSLKIQSINLLTYKHTPIIQSKHATCSMQYSTCNRKVNFKIMQEIEKHVCTGSYSEIMN